MAVIRTEPLDPSVTKTVEQSHRDGGHGSKSHSLLCFFFKNGFFFSIVVVRMLGVSFASRVYSNWANWLITVDVMSRVVVVLFR